MVRSTLLHFSLLDGPSGKNPRFYKFVCICTFRREIKAALLKHPGQLTIVILVHFLSFHGGPHLFELMLKPQVAKENCQFALLPLRGSPVVRILCSLYFRWVPKVVRSILLHFSQLDGPSGKNPGFHEFVCICTFNCEIKAA